MSSSALAPASAQPSTSLHPTPASKQTRTMREKVLRKATAKSVTSEKLLPPTLVTNPQRTAKAASEGAVAEMPPPAVPERRRRPLKATDSAAASVMAASSPPAVQGPTPSVIERVINWEHCGISPPKAVESDEDSDVSAFDADDFCAPSRGRPSMLTAPSGKRTGVQMDMATRLANDMLLRGKDAIETAGNMRKDLKAKALEALQTLYETVLSLSDSRFRHINNLERERTRHATELVRVERAHSKAISDLTKGLTGELSLARTDITADLNETKAIRDWLGYETREPHRMVAETHQLARGLDTKLGSLQEIISKEGKNDIEPLRRDYASVKAGVESLSSQLDGMRRDLHKNQERTAELLGESSKFLSQLESRPLASAEPDPGVQRELAAMRETLTTMAADKITAPLPLPTPQLDLGEHLQPITERLEAVSSELRTIRAEKMRSPPPTRSLQAELALVEGVKPTYAKVAARPPPAPKPNHTLIISSTNPNNTADNVIERIRVALDTSTTGAKVNRVRKARNKRVVLSCPSKEDLNLVHGQVQRDKDLRAEVAKAGNPLVVVRDVLSVHTDAQLVANLLKQNNHLLQGVDLKETTVRVRYRKKARNPHECHPVFEVSPQLHKRLVEAKKVYIGIQWRPVMDQSPLVQCAKCLGFGHTRKVCRESEDQCSHCGGAHSWEKCGPRREGIAPKCKNCLATHRTGQEIRHNAFSDECPEREKWDSIARSRISYC